MGWRGGGRGRSGPWPGNGPFRNLPPWQRPGRLYGRGFGYGYGGFGYGRGAYGRGYGGVSPYSCARFPWLPRWWWANPTYGYTAPYGGVYPAYRGYPAPAYTRAYPSYSPYPQYW